MKKFFVVIMSSFLLFSCWSDIDDSFDAVDILLLPFHVKSGITNDNAPITQPFTYENETVFISQSGKKITVSCQKKTTGDQFFYSDENLISDGLVQIQIEDGNKLQFLYDDKKLVFDLQNKHTKWTKLFE
ncbi:MAG: hypothetical protein IPL63_11420 [Saprospiraceae bacterium]|nr:hypothetical protein [Saprospiraceae bacterium]MBK8547945.1 hypothetical protein [Saprospiraceae bacterium]MBK9044057.1 hypothetical protein [Saprospiraceae bacterium]MBP6695146.1 hypothetical protein [Saprospiraceae bacterium]